MRVHLLAAFFVGLLPISLQAQEVVEVSTDRLCRDCTISAEHIATLGSLEDSISPALLSKVARDHAGNFYVGPTTSPGRIAVYGSGGKLLETLGREGEGPGEFKRVRWVRVTGGDTLHVLSAGRHTIMLTTGEVISTHPAPSSVDVFHVLEDRRVLWGGDVVSPDRFGLPAHILGPGGGIIRSFGNTSGDPYGEGYLGTRRNVSFSRGDHIWINPYGQYSIELWDTLGVHSKTLVRNPPWFEPWERTRNLSPFQERPQPRITSVHEDASGLLWVFARVPEGEWNVGAEFPAFELVYDMVVEVIDPISGHLLVSHRFNDPGQLFSYFFSEDLVFAERAGKLGERIIEIWRLSVAGPMKRRIP